MFATPLTLTPEDYFRIDEASPERIEYWNGQIFVMAGETPNHSRIKDNVIFLLRDRKPDCQARTSGVRVMAPGYGRRNYAYPDGILTCGAEDYDTTANPPALRNPTLLVEVTSESTRSFDLDEKLFAYFQIEALREYWVVDAERARVIQYSRVGERVQAVLYAQREAVLHSEALGLAVPLDDLYQGVTWPPSDDQPSLY